MTSRLAFPGFLLVAVCVSYFAGRTVAVAPDSDPSDHPASEGGKPDAFPQAGFVLPLSGHLGDGSGMSLKKGTYKVLVSLYSGVEKDAIPDCASEIELRIDENGQFAAHLDLEKFAGFKPENIDGRLLYLGIRVEADAEGKPMIGSPELSPRICIWPVLFAKNAGLLSGISWEHIDARLRKLEDKTQNLSVPDRNK